MALINRTRSGTRNQKKSLLVLAANLTITDLGASGAAVELFELPENVLMVRATLDVKTAFNAGTAILFVLSVGSSVFVSAISVTSPGFKSLTLTQRDSGNLGAKVTLAATIIGAAPTVGEAELVLTGLEYTKNTGEFISYSTT